VENTRYAHAFHSRQWSNYNIDFEDDVGTVKLCTALTVYSGYRTLAEYSGRK